MCVLCTPFIDKEVHVWQQGPLRRLLHMWALYTCNDQVGASISRAGSHMQGLICQITSLQDMAAGKAASHCKATPRSRAPS